MFIIREEFIILLIIQFVKNKAPLELQSITSNYHIADILFYF
jgi:hypothetical protein